MNEEEITSQSSPSDDKENPDNKSGQSSDQKGVDSEEKSGEPKAGKKDAEARIQQLVARQKELEAKLNQVQQPSTDGKPKISPEAQKALDQLSGIGVVTEQKLETRIRSLEDRIVLDTEHSRLEQSLDGADGRPKYDRKEVEEFMKARAIYDPETAYEKMHRDEIIDWHVKQSQQKPAPARSEGASTPGATGQGGDVISRDTIREKMGTAEWRSFYEQNRDKILTLMQKGQL